VARDIARGIAALIGLFLIGLGSFGLIDNPLVGSNGVFAAGPLLDVGNLALGLIAVAISFAPSDEVVRRGLIVIGVVALALAAGLAIDPTVAVILSAPANLLDELVYGTVGLLAIWLGVAAGPAEEAAESLDDW
jgi:hypothetical protein